jgi:hypothetical protein
MHDHSDSGWNPYKPVNLCAPSDVMPLQVADANKAASLDTKQAAKYRIGEFFCLFA